MAKPKPVEVAQQLLPEINIGMIGHVDHGKTTLTKALTGKWTDTHSEEIKRGITIRLGYADARIYKCAEHGYATTEKCPACGKPGALAKTVSIVDAPGHETLMTTVLSGAAIMDGALLLVSAAEKCPQPQTREHLKVMDIVGIRNLVIVQNKIDVVEQAQALENYRQIKNFVKGSVAENAPVVPISAQQGINLNELLAAIQERIPTPKRDPASSPKMLIARSFDINKPGTAIASLKGGVVGGSLIAGRLKVGDEIEIRPGVKVKDRYQPVFTIVTGLQKAGYGLADAGPGGLLGIATNLDPSLTKSDSLAGNILGHPGKLPAVMDEIAIKVNLLERVIGMESEAKVERIKEKDLLLLTAGIARTVGTVTEAGEKMKVRLRIPICAEKKERVAVSRQIMGRWRLIGWGEII